MRYIADLHLHSRYAGGCSEHLNLKNMEAAAASKGIGLLGTGDFTHPMWIKEIKEGLEESTDGIYRLKGRGEHVGFVLSTEVAVIFEPGKGKLDTKPIFSRQSNIKKVHNCIIAPSIESAEAINDTLSKFGNLGMDGRPLLNMSLAEFVERVRAADKNAFIYPAHAWTPWFGVFGSISGFNSIKEAYEDQAAHIHALETGLSSDPAMNWRVSSLDRLALISGSDAHSAQKLGREAIVIEAEEGLTYNGIIERITKKEINYTIEFYPEEGKYHYDGHRSCNISLSPLESKGYNGICPKCRKPLTLGVEHRVEDLADREKGRGPEKAVPFVHVVPLLEILAYVSGKGVASQYVKNAYNSMTRLFESEFGVLLDAEIPRLKAFDMGIGTAIENIRAERIRISPGYDGVFGTIDILGRQAEKKQSRQSRIADF